MTLENTFYETISKKRNIKSDYDCVVLFSGGKDSTYLAHILKMATNGRVCLFTVDNSFEDTQHAKLIATKLNLDLFICKPKEVEVNSFYNFILSEPIMKEIDSNPLCFLCNRYFTSLGIEFADKFHIPFVVSGLTNTQIFGSRMPLSLRLVEISEKVLNGRFKKVYDTIKTTERYQKDSIVKRIIDKMFFVLEDVEIIRPFQYLEYNIEKIKKTLEDTYGWQNSVPNLTNDKYITSGCKLTELFGLFERKLGYTIREFNEYKLDYEDGSLSYEAFRYGTESLNDMMNQEVSEEMKEIICKLGLDDKLLEKQI